MTSDKDLHFMSLTLDLARQAYREDEVPVGALVVHKDAIISSAYNQNKKLQDPTAHAEILAITQASGHLGVPYLLDCTLYVSLEPCLMCAGAVAHARLKRLIFAARDQKKGYLVFAPNFAPAEEVCYGILEKEACQLLQLFFRGKRIKKA